MLILILLLSTPWTSHCQNPEESEETHSDIAHLQRDVNILSYTENFKNVLTDYVNAQYKNLTIDELEKVKSTIEQFFVNFALDLRRIVDKSDARDSTEGSIDDGLSDEPFNDIRERIKQAFPDISEGTAGEIVRALRRNLLKTRENIDNIIVESQNSQIVNEQS